MWERGVGVPVRGGGWEYLEERCLSTWERGVGLPGRAALEYLREVNLSIVTSNYAPPKKLDF